MSLPLFSLETGILLWLHAFGAVAWLGGVLLFGILVTPTLSKLSAPARDEVVINLFPKLVRYIEGFGVFTVVLGFLSLYAFTSNFFFAIMTLTSQFGLFMIIGAVLALVAVGLSFGLIGPSFLKVARITKEMRKAPPTSAAGSSPPTELQKAFSRGKAGAAAELILLILALVCMVAAVS